MSVNSKNVYIFILVRGYVSISAYNLAQAKAKFLSRYPSLLDNLLYICRLVPCTVEGLKLFSDTLKGDPD